MTLMKKLVFVVYLLSLTFANGQQNTPPKWIDDPTAVPKNTGLTYFVGISREGDRNQAREDAEMQASKTFGVTVESFVKDKTFFGKNRIGDGFQVGRDYQGETTHASRATNIQLNDEAWYTDSGIVYGLFSLSPATLLSEEYKPLVELGESQTALTDIIWVYTAIIEELDRNPQHKKIAYHVEDKAPLYQYLNTQLRNLLNSITVETAPLMQVGDALAVRVKSNAVPNIGGIRCRVSVNGKNAVEYPLDGQDTFAVFETTALVKGKYTLQYELLLKDAVPGGNTNISNKNGKVSFEVVPLLAYIDFVGSDLTDTEKRTLTQSVQLGIQQNRVPVQTLVAGGEFDTGNHYVLEVTVDLVSSVKQMDYDIYKYAVSLSLVKNGRNLQQSEAKTITQMSRPRIIEGASKFIRENTDFFRETSVYLQEK